MKKDPRPPAGSGPPRVFRTEAENRVGQRMGEIFDAGSDSTEIKLENFAKYVRRQPLKRLLAMYEVFKLVLPVKGSVVECGVYKGFGLMSWAKLSTILEPENLTRRIYGFDTFEGFPAVTQTDGDARPGMFAGGSYDELLQLIQQYDQDRFLGHIPKVELVKGDMCVTIPEFVRNHPHLVVSLLFIDCDLYEPTRAALEAFVPRMPKGSVIAFDELDNPKWPGETQAALEAVGLNKLRLRRCEWDPYIAFAVLD